MHLRIQIPCSRVGPLRSLPPMAAQTSSRLVRRLAKNSTLLLPTILSRFLHTDSAETSQYAVHLVKDLTSTSNLRAFCTRNPNTNDLEGPAAIDYHSLLQEDEFHKLADATIHELQEKFEDYGDTSQIDGFDIDYGNQVLTLRLGNLGTYVINKQTPNRQIWLSSPVSGPSRFDWDPASNAWVYRRTSANLLTLLETELVELCVPRKLPSPRKKAEMSMLWGPLPDRAYGEQSKEQEMPRKQDR